MTLAVDAQHGNDDRLVGDEALRDPVLGRQLVWRVDDECTVNEIRGRLDNESAVDAREPLGKGEAAERVFRAQAVHERINLRGCAESNHCTAEQIVLHGKANAKAGAEPRRVLNEEAVSLEKARRAVDQIRRMQQIRADECAQARRRLMIVHRIGDGGDGGRVRFAPLGIVGNVGHGELSLWFDACQQRVHDSDLRRRFIRSGSPSVGVIRELAAHLLKPHPSAPQHGVCME